MAEKLYYVQDARWYVGNCVLWWALDHKGYTCEIDRAHVFTETELSRASRDTDVAWPKAEVDLLISRHVDMQKLRRIEPYEK
jgi:hypothetical protein